MTEPVVTREQIAAEIVAAAAELFCQCYSPDDLEWDPAGPCPKCRIVDAAEALAGAA